MTTRKEYEARRDAVSARMTADPRLFDMNDLIRNSECGTVCCIAGHTLFEMGEAGVDELGFWVRTTRQRADGWLLTTAEYLGIPTSYARHLFVDYTIKDPETAALRLKEAPYVGS